MQTKRIESIDILRGLVMALMTLDHVREFFFMSSPLSDPMNLETTTPLLFFNRWISSFCAPTFIFLAGLSAYLYGKKVGKKECSLFLLKRGIFLLLLEITLINFAWTFAFPPSMFYLQVIWAIGFAMIFLAFIIWLPRYLIAVVSLFLIIGQHLFSGVSFESGIFNVLWSIFYEKNVIPLTSDISFRTTYPVLPWVGVIALGYLYGVIFTKEYNPIKRKFVLLISSSASILSFFLLRFNNLYGENKHLFKVFSDDLTKTVMSFFNLTKYPPSLLFILITLSFSMAFLHYFDIKKRLIKNILLNFGRVPLFYYILHLYFLHLIYSIASLITNNTNYNLSSPLELWFVSILTLVLLYPAVVWFGKIKVNSQNSLLRYL